MSLSGLGMLAGRRRPVRLGAAGLMVMLLGSATGNVSANDRLTDNRQTATGKPLSFRSMNQPQPLNDDEGAQPHLAPDVTRDSTPSARRQDELLPVNTTVAGGGSREAAEPIAGGAEMTSPRAFAPSHEIGTPEEGLLGQPPYPSSPNCDTQGGWPHGYLQQQIAQPLVAASCGSRPFHVDALIGAVRASELIAGHIDQSTGVIGGTRLGWDYDPYWGLETRVAYSSIQDTTEATPPVESADKVLFWDSNLLYYPWGDSRCRPFLNVGFGLAEFNFIDDAGAWHRRGLIEVPIGGGVKYRIHDWLTLRAEIFDNIAFGQGQLSTVHMVSFTTGLEYHFGGSHRSYWPWEPSGR